MRSIILFILGSICSLNAQSALKEWIWPDNTDRFHVGEITAIYLYLLDSSPGLELIDYKYRKNRDHIRLYVGNNAKWDTQYKNIKKVKIYRNDRSLIMLEHGITDTRKKEGTKNNKITYVADRYLLPKNTEKITVNLLEESGVRHDFKVKRNQNKMVIGENDITKKFNLEEIRWQKRIPRYKTIAYAKKGDQEYIIESIKDGIALSNVRSTVLLKNIITDFYGRCIVINKNEYIAGYEYKIKNQFMAPKGVTLAKASIKDKMQYIEFNHRVMLPIASCPPDYNEQTRVEMTLSCTTNHNRVFTDKRYIYLPFIYFPPGVSSCD